MTYYSALPIETRLVLAAVLFLAALGELALCLYRTVGAGKLKRGLLPGLIYLVLIGVLSFSIDAQQVDKHSVFPPKIPWLVFPLVSLLVLIHTLYGLVKERKRLKNSLTQNSVREALDQLHTGIAFADSLGRIILINRSMNRVCAELLGRFPQTVQEITDALGPPPAPEDAEGTEGQSLIFRFPSGRVWRFSYIVLNNAGLQGFRQITAQDITDLHRVNEEIAKDNEAIRASIRKMNEMIARMDELAREEETLNLKIRTHNDIGASLIALSEMATGDQNATIDEQLRILTRALAYLSGGGYANREEEELPFRFAAECGVNLVAEGTVPRDKTFRELVAAAIRECVTNCVRHAHGNRVTVGFVERQGVLSAVITNNGKPPKEEIKEGGGLSSLRRKIENAGGEMTVSRRPEFVLNISFPKERDKS